MAIDAERPEFTKAAEDWALVDDMCDERNFSSHIPDLDVLGTEVTSDGKVTKNQRFKDRASFLGASRITLQSMIGTAFERDPAIELPAGLEYLTTNADGTGVDLPQQMQAATGEALRKARGGLFVTMPETNGSVSLADQEALRFVATIHMIKADRIINWWTQTDGAETYLAGVVFTEADEVIDDYEVSYVDVCRELALDENGNFFDRKWIKTDSAWEPQEAIYPTQGDGSLWNRIPFMFFGAECNSWAIQTPPLLGLARKNRDHLRNSAINEEGIWFSGHIQPVADEMDPTAFDTISKDQGFKIGGGQLLIAKGFDFKVAEPNTAARQGMMDKAEEMAAMGARLLKPGSVAKTAQQDAGEQKTLHSVLSLIAVNVSDAYQWAVEQAANFMNITGEIDIDINRGFMEPEVTAEKMRELRENMLAGIIGPAEMFMALRRAGDIDPEKTLDDYLEDIDSRGMVASDIDPEDDGGGNVVELLSGIREGMNG